MADFVWTKMQAEGGQTLSAILARKEAERRAGNGVFWWGVGNSLGQAVGRVAVEAGGMLPVLFSQMVSRPKRRDSSSSDVFLWEEWEDASGIVRKIPQYVLEWSRGAEGKTTHYALVCESSNSVELRDHGPFDPSRRETHLGKKPGSSQVTALLRGDPTGNHSPGIYHWGFRANLVSPWVVKLVHPRRLSDAEREAFGVWKAGDNWSDLVAKFRGPS
jgi:hypothetical protein